MSNTTNYNLIKPTYDDAADIQVINDNMDIIDAQMKINADAPSVIPASYIRKNLLINNAVSKTVNGITFTVNSNGTITVNGTATATTNLSINTHFENNAQDKTEYILSGCPSGGTTSSYRINMSAYMGSTWKLGKADTGSGVRFVTDFATANRYDIYITISEGITVNNLIFKPMIRLASVADDTYVPYVTDLQSRLMAIEYNQNALMEKINSLTTAVLALNAE